MVPTADYSALIVDERFDLGEIRSFILEGIVGALERALTTVAGAPLRGLDYRFPYAPPPWAEDSVTVRKHST